MNRVPSEPKPTWVKLTGVAIAVSLGAPILCSLIFRRNYEYWQLLALLVAAIWLFVCGFFTVFNPLAVARWFGRPGTYDLLLHDKHPTFSRTYFAVAGAVMMLIAIFVGSFFFILRNPLPPAVPSTAVHP